MPIYEYVCRKCDHPFEALVRGAEQAVCPECESKSLEKQLSTFAAGASRSLPPACAGSTAGCPTAGACAAQGCPHSV